MTHINQRRDTAAQWAFENPVLQNGELGWETDTRQAKLGNGTVPWNDLPYAVLPPASPQEWWGSTSTWGFGPGPSRCRP